nr:MAG TPA: hypothetical protein [Caudoviricetes sp.]
MKGYSKSTFVKLMFYKGKNYRRVLARCQW